MKMKSQVGMGIEVDIRSSHHTPPSVLVNKKVSTSNQLVLTTS
jgi:hypothetical protein